MPKPKVAFICVHNSCRSQIAEALAKRYYSEFFDAYSAGTEIKSQINQDAVRIMKSQFDIDMEENQYSKLIDVLPPIDIVVTMGCNVNCPYLPCRHREDWGLDDPSGKNDDAFLETISQIQKKLETLADSMK
ncbi:arsenate reductase ArsC [Streptococcus suis]|uniref:arsenate reductase ArsC n=1 Tax=Streptococcus suis TaxID=1307 RepID=UPI000426AB77|nr:arsenate reductase ArsC [Streptococcus suis]